VSLVDGSLAFGWTNEELGSFTAGEFEQPAEIKVPESVNALIDSSGLAGVEKDRLLWFANDLQATGAMTEVEHRSTSASTGVGSG
jgi:hypothetical protein